MRMYVPTVGDSNLLGALEGPYPIWITGVHHEEQKNFTVCRQPLVAITLKGPCIVIAHMLRIFMARM